MSAGYKRIQYSCYGGPDVMRVEAFQLPAPGKDEVLVQVRFAAINPIDWKLRQGRMKLITGRTFPRAMGMDFSGVVLAVGASVSRFQVGDAVFGLSRFKESGALGEAVVTREDFLASKPDTLSFADAACLGTPGITAWNGLIDKARLQAGQQVFINGCAGAVGEAAVQIALMSGATVSGSCSASDAARAQALGVSTVYDYRLTDLKRLPTRFDVVYDTAASMTVSTGIGLLRPGGCLLDLNPGPGKFLRGLIDRRLKLVIGTPRHEILETLASAASEARLKIRLGEVVPLDGAIQLIRELEQGRKLGGKGVVAMER